MMKILNLKLVILLQHENIQTFLQRAMFKIGMNKFLLLKISLLQKLLFRGHMLSVILKGKRFLECFTKKNCKIEIKKSLELRK